MTWFGWSVCCYALLLGAFLGAEIGRQRRGGAAPWRVVHRFSAGVLLGWPFAIGIGGGDQMTAHQQLAMVLTPFVLLFLFALHMACRKTWRHHFEKRVNGDEP